MRAKEFGLTAVEIPAALRTNKQQLTRASMKLVPNIDLHVYSGRFIVRLGTKSNVPLIAVQNQDRTYGPT